MQQRRNRREPLLEHVPQSEAIFREAEFSSKVTHSGNFGEDCRLVLLGGDDFAKHEACRFILRNGQTQQTSDVEWWEVKENYVQRRHVTVAISPSSWLESLRLSFFLSWGIKKTKNDIKKCVSVVFPGPHAFLVVIRDGRDTGKEHYLTKAVASVFGKEALDYSMVLIIKGAGAPRSEPASMKCVKKCGKRHHFLEDTDISVQELFRKVEKMVAKQKLQFFIPSDFKHFMETDFEQWEMKQISHFKSVLAERSNEKDIIIEKLKEDLGAAQHREQKLKKKLDISQHREQELSKELDISRHREHELRKELDISRHREHKLRKELDISRHREHELRKELDISRHREHELRKELDIAQHREHELRTELDTSQHREQALKAQLDVSQKENELKKQFIFQQRKINQTQIKCEVRKEECELERDNTEQKPQHAETKNCGGSKGGPFSNC
ncbi:golgin subfamily A member 6-like protein 7 isoform X2 [Silurus meridionalis]|uniref:golgin subfamily A member 6-like protein 7 isoform X2 n=1 Tax=Silurus meridionalis TaxID=175797 RepID=UPI001EEB1F7C|nr:golgin subfamily A member 6-like protein 7 isoform X2 [Silurus meridionalis]